MTKWLPGQYVEKLRYAYDELNQLLREDNAYAGKLCTHKYNSVGWVIMVLIIHTIAKYIFTLIENEIFGSVYRIKEAAGTVINYNNCFWGDSTLEKIEIVYDQINITVYNDVWQKILVYNVSNVLE